MPEIPMHSDFPVPVARFVKSLAATPDEVWSHMLLSEHRGENHTVVEWKAILDTKRNRKV